MIPGLGWKIALMISSPDSLMRFDINADSSRLQSIHIARFIVEPNSLSTIHSLSTSHTHPS